MQRYTVFFTIVNALQVSDGFSAQHQELKNCTHSIGYMPSLQQALCNVASCCLYWKEYIIDARTHKLQTTKQVRHIIQN